MWWELVSSGLMTSSMGGVQGPQGRVEPTSLCPGLGVAIYAGDPSFGAWWVLNCIWRGDSVTRLRFTASVIPFDFMDQFAWEHRLTKVLLRSGVGSDAGSHSRHGRWREQREGGVVII